MAIGTPPSPPVLTRELPPLISATSRVMVAPRRFRRVVAVPPAPEPGPGPGSELVAEGASAIVQSQSSVVELTSLFLSTTAKKLQHGHR